MLNSHARLFTKYRSNCLFNHTFPFAGFLKEIHEELTFFVKFHYLLIKGANKSLLYLGIVRPLERLEARVVCLEI
jgi:hypothetical protein